MGTFKGFDEVELRKPQRSTFDLSHEKRVSGRIGRLIPILCTETMPNDTFHGSSEVLVKLAPMIAPIYHRLNLYVHYFFVPNRLLWKDWEPFITGGAQGEFVTTPPVPPYYNVNLMLLAGASLLDKGSIADYFGVPNIPDAAAAAWNAGQTIDAMPFAAYFRIYNDYYRDRNYYADSNYLPMASGQNTVYGLAGFRQRCWEHDYFTSALPWTQRGSQVLMPIAGSVTPGTFRTGDIRKTVDSSLASTGPLKSTLGQEQVNASENVYHDVIGTGTISSSTITINDLRRAVRLQEWLERNALAGSRYNESIMAHFGRKTSDSRLQRAEYIGGGKAVIQISEVMTTAFSTDSTPKLIPPANPAGRGSTYANTNGFHYNCEEHGFIIGILSCMPTSAYMQGLPRMFQNRNTFLDYPWPSFAHLGEQPVYNNEIYMNPASVPGNRASQPLFGYQSRYADWKYIPSSSHGDFRTTLDVWHLTRKFASQPVLSQAFVEFEDALQNRVFNVANVDTLWMYIYNKISAKRSLPYFGTPLL